MTRGAAHTLVERLRIVAGTPRPLERVRHVSRVEALRRLTRGRAAAEVPALLAAVLSLCGEQHRLTARRALDAAKGEPGDPTRVERERRYLRATCLREQLLRVGLDASAATGEPLPTDLQGLPRVPATAPAQLARAAEVDALRRLIGWAEQRVLGVSADAWWLRYAPSSAGVRQWAEDARGSTTPVAAWLARVRARASSLALELPRAALLDDPSRNLPLLAAALRSDPQFAERPELAQRSLESGPFNRAAWPRAQRSCAHVFDLLAARIVDIVRLCRAEPWLESGALSLGPGEAVAYCELARGLLVHWVKLAPSELRAGRAVVADYRILTPSDFALHPEGALAKGLRAPDLTVRDVRLLLAAFDPCLEVELVGSPEARPAHA